MFGAALSADYTTLSVVGERGLEPPRPCGHSALNATCLPIPPFAHIPILYLQLIYWQLTYFLTRFSSINQFPKPTNREAGSVPEIAVVPLSFLPSTTKLNLIGS